MVYEFLKKVWFIVTATLLWLIIIPFLVPLLPIFILVCVTKTIEELIYKIFYSSIHFKIEDVPWLYDTAENPTIINCLVVMETKMSVENLRHILNERLVKALKDDTDNNKNSVKSLKYPRASRYIHAGYLNYYWLKEEEFRIDRHVYEWDKHSYDSESAVKEVISELATRPLITKENLSPWEYILIHFTDKGEDRSAIFFRCHHSLTDGVSQMYFLINQLSDNKFDYDGVGGGYNLTAAEKWMIRIKSFLLFPYNAMGQFPKLFKDTKTLFDCPKMSGKKRLTYTKPISLDLVKAVKWKLNVTVNDVMVGCLATCLHNYLRKRGDQVPAEFETTVPLDTRLSIDEAKEFSNKISITHLSLPTSSGDPVKNILEVHKRMCRVKDNLVGLSVRLTMRLLGYFTPMWATNLVIGKSIRGVNMVLSNLPGPQQQLALSGHKIQFLTFWPPAKNNIGSSCSIFSYDGNIYIGICSDEMVTKYPEQILADLDDVLSSLVKMTGVSDGLCKLRGVANSMETASSKCIPAKANGLDH